MSVTILLIGVLWFGGTACPPFFFVSPGPVTFSHYPAVSPRPRRCPFHSRPRLTERRKQSVSYQNSELALLEARIKQAEKLLEEKKQRLAGRSPTTSSRNNVPDYAPNPAFSATAKADDKAGEEAADTKDGAGEQGGYQARPPPPPPIVPTSF